MLVFVANPNLYSYVRGTFQGWVFGSWAVKKKGGMPQMGRGGLSGFASGEAQQDRDSAQAYAGCAEDGWVNG